MKTFSSTAYLSSSVLSTAVEGENIVAIDATPAFYSFSLEGEFLNSTTLNGLATSYDRYGHEITFSQDAKHALVCDGDGDKVLFINVQTKKVVGNIAYSNHPEFVRFSENGNLFVIANSIGKISVYTVHDLSLLFEYAIYDAVSSALFCDDLTYLAVASLDKKLHIFNLENRTLFQEYAFEDIPQALAFSKENSEMSVFMRKGNTLALNLKLKGVFGATPFYEWPTVATRIVDTDVVILGTRSSKVYLYTTSKGTLIGSAFLDCWGITSINIYNDILFFGSADGKITKIDASQEIADAFEYLKANDLKQLVLLVERFPFILINKSLCESLENSYSEIFAYNPKTDQEKQGYEQLVALILADNGKRAEFLKLVRSCEQFASFLSMIETGENESACSLALEYPLLRQLRELSRIHDKCYKNISLQVALLEEDIQLFHNYMKKAETPCIKCPYNIVPSAESLENAYREFKLGLTASDYEKLFDLVEKFPVFRSTRLYRRIVVFGETLIEKILKSMRILQMREAYMYALKLATLKPFNKTALDFQTQIISYRRFIKAIEINNIEQIFLIALQNPVLKATPAYKTQLNTYKNIYKSLQPVAKKGDITQIISVLHPYERVKIFQEKNKQLYKRALLSGILLYVRMGKEIDALNEYHRCFGWDAEYEKICMMFHVDVNTALNSRCDISIKECKNLLNIIVTAKLKRVS